MQTFYYPTQDLANKCTTIANRNGWHFTMQLQYDGDDQVGVVRAWSRNKIPQDYAFQLLGGSWGEIEEMWDNLKSMMGKLRY
jgi:hypothetical protein